MAKWLPLLSLLIAASAAAVPVWTWVDEDGQRHYSDQPVPGATRLEIAEPPVYSAPPPAQRAPAAVAEVTTEEPPAIQAYTTFALVRPAEQETIWNIEGNLAVHVDLQPPLQEGHRLDVYLDGERKHVNSRSPDFVVPEVYRGEHTLRAVLLDADGRELRHSQTITFYVHQTSILRPRSR